MASLSSLSQVPAFNQSTVLAILATVVALFLSGSPVLAQEYEELPEGLEARAQGLYAKTQCPQCDGQTIQQSHAPIAVTMRQIVREQLLAGDTDDEIMGFLVDAYGDSIMASPPKRGFGAIVWIIPPVVILLGAIAVFLAVRRMRQASPIIVAAGQSAEVAATVMAPYLTLVDQEMEADDHG